MGRRVIAFLAGLCVFAACGLGEVGVVDQEKGDDIWIGPGNTVVGDSTEPGVGKKTWYTVGVDYPEGYDWRVDAEKGSVKCSLVVFANGIAMMKVPVGDKYEVSSDPDMHRMIGSSLYTYYSTADETVIKRNGEQMFRYKGREMIVDMVVREDNIYTLGQSRDSSGFSLRENGRILLERSSGYPFQHLQVCDDGLSFAFCEILGSGDIAQERYYHYLSGEVCQVAVREDIKKVWDIIFLNDKLCYLASMVGISTPVLAVGNELSPLKVPLTLELRNCRFMPDANDLNIEGILYHKRLKVFSGLWKGTECKRAFSPGYIVASMCGWDDALGCVLNSPLQGSGGIIYRGGESWAIPDGYMSMGGQTVAVVDGMFHVGLTSKTGDGVAVWVDNEMKPLKINGFISHMSVD